MKIIIVLLISVIQVSCVRSGLGIINGLAKSSDFIVHSEIQYGSHQQNKLDIYLPKHQKARATLLFFYGGCWGHCSQLVKNNYLFVAEALTQQGYAVVIPDYRKYPDVNFNEIMMDARDAVLWMIKNGQEYGIENKPLFLMGHSAGAHIAATLVTNKSHLNQSISKINGFIGLAGPYDFYPFSDDYMYQLFSPENDYFDSQPINLISGTEPPFLLIHGENDKKVSPKNATHLSEKLNTFQVEHDLIMLEKKRHAGLLIDMARPFRKNSAVLAAINKFIEKHTKTTNPL